MTTVVKIPDPVLVQRLGHIGKAVNFVKERDLIGLVPLVNFFYLLHELRRYRQIENDFSEFQAQLMKDIETLSPDDRVPYVVALGEMSRMERGLDYYLRHYQDFAGQGCTAREYLEQFIDRKMLEHQC